jgi:hypothetical protein
MTMTVVGQPVEHVAEIHVGHVAERHDLREADLARHRPVDHRRRHGTGLRDEGKVALGRHHMREGRVEADARHHHAKAVRPDDAHQVGARGLEHRALEFLAAPLAQFAEARRDDDRGLAAARTQFADQAGNGFRRRADDGKVGHRRHACHIAVGEDALDGVVLGIDRQDRACKTGMEKIARKDGADRPGLRRRPDQRHRFGGEQLVQIADRHLAAAC